MIYPVLTKIILIITLIGVLGIGIIRAKGEFHTKRIIEGRSSGDHQLVIRSVDKAKSLFYNVDNFAMPLEWYKGSAYVSIGNISKALSSFIKAYEISPYNVQVLNNLGSAYEVTGDHENAKRIYLEAIEISPDFPDPKLNLTVILFNEGKYDEALKLVKQVKAINRRRPYLDAIRNKIKEQNQRNRKRKL